MVHLELDDEETVLMEQMLVDCLSDLRVEISDTHSMDYKMMLKDKKAVLIKIQKALELSKQEPVTG